MTEVHRFQFIVDYRGHVQRRCVRGVPCNARGCHRLGDPCWLPDDREDKPSEHYCWAHVYDAGYCRGCGQFWAGVESFDFSRSGLCENCASQGDYEDDWREDEGEWWDEPRVDPWEQALSNCYSMDGGRTCGAAGSEECEFECIFRRDYYRSLRRNE